MAARAASAKGQPGASRRKPCRLQLRTSHEEAWENNPTRSPRGSSRTALSWCLQMGRLERRGGRGPPAAPQAAAPRAQRPAHTACAWAGALVWNRAVDRAHRRWAEPAAGRGAHPSAQPCGGSPSTHLLDVSRQVFRGKRQGRSPGHTGWAGGPWSHPKPVPVPRPQRDTGSGQRRPHTVGPMTGATTECGDLEEQPRRRRPPAAPQGPGQRATTGQASVTQGCRCLELLRANTLTPVSGSADLSPTGGITNPDQQEARCPNGGRSSHSTCSVHPEPCGSSLPWE